jgi:hypothetical protein
MSRKLKSAVSRSHEEATVESFRKDPAFSAEYLNAVLEDGDQEELMLALRRSLWGRSKTRRKGKVERQYPLPYALAKRESRTEKLEGGSTGDGNAAHSPSPAETRRVTQMALSLSARRTVPSVGRRHVSAHPVRLEQLERLERSEDYVEL